MAEHDDLARQAAEALLGGPYRVTRDNAWGQPQSVSADLIINEVLARYFAAARKEAREGALEEAARFSDGLRIELANSAERAKERRRPSVATSLSLQASVAGHCARLIRTLRSKPKEPAVADPADQLLRSIAEQSKAECPTGGAHLFAVILDDHCIDTIKRLTLTPEANETETRATAADYRNRATGERIAWTAPPGELIRTACIKCGLPGIVDLGWSPQPEETAR